MNLGQKKQLVSLIAKGQLPQTIVKRDSKYLVSENEKHTVSILLNDEFADEWVAQLGEKEYITDFYIITKNNRLFSELKEKIQNLLGEVVYKENVTRPLSMGFEANLKYFRCDWTPRRPEEYLLSNVLCLHIKEMIELQNAMEIDGVKNVLLLNKIDIKNKILDANNYALVERIWLNQNIILSADEMKLLSKKGFKYIPKEFFGQELKEAAE